MDCKLEFKKTHRLKPRNKKTGNHGDHGITPPPSIQANFSTEVKYLPTNL